MQRTPTTALPYHQSTPNQNPVLLSEPTPSRRRTVTGSR